MFAQKSYSENKQKIETWKVENEIRNENSQSLCAQVWVKNRIGNSQLSQWLVPIFRSRKI